MALPTLAEVGRRTLWMLGWMSCGVNALLALLVGEDVRACGFALLGILLVVAAQFPVAPLRSGSDARATGGGFIGGGAAGDDSARGDG